MTTLHNTMACLVALFLISLLCGCGASTTIEVSITVGDVRGGPTLSASTIDRILSDAGSPAGGLGATLYRLSERYQIDDAVALAFFNRESNYGKKGVARFTRSLGNIRCTPGWNCIEGYRAYASFEEGAADWYQLITTVYIADGRTTVATIIPKYAPQEDNNNEADYISGVHADVSFYRQLALNG